MLWDQHRERFTAGEYTCRRIPYTKFRELTSSMSDEDMARIGRLNAKRESGAMLSPEETESLNAIASKWPIDDLRGACMIPPVSGEDMRGILARMPRGLSESFEAILDRCVTPEIPEQDALDPLAAVLAPVGGLGIDIADMTVGQGMALTAMLTPRRE